MMFRTFNSNIDKISSNWGMFEKAFNDIGTAIVGRITDINKAFQGRMIWLLQSKIQKVYRRKSQIW